MTKTSDELALKQSFLIARKLCPNNLKCSAVYR